ncbi:sigma-70 family RNA polymerase sigma factor [Pseudonocardia oroxyli]|uniref:sigma-70 family RNA polymerase sigma factor n=1 Tax=Pseudonocardia oroxyli TaxID=366584 RepID=UPI000B825188|nr:sigma-70 family RNA polymerase sigma factor [Pseudonocardia oroxyli]
MYRPEPAAPPGVSAGPGPLTEEDLLDALAAGDRSALAGLYDRYGRQAWALARRICADDAHAEDAVQEAFLAVWRGAARFDATRGRVGTWVMTLVHHKAVDLVRREEGVRRRTTTLDEQQPLPAAPGADGAALASVTAAAVRRALAALPEEQRHALSLAYFGGYTQREVASLTDSPLGTVKSRMFAGLARLRTALGPVLAEGDLR